MESTKKTDFFARDMAAIATNADVLQCHEEFLRKKIPKSLWLQ